MLSDKLDSLMIELKLSSVDIAGSAGFDRSNVSRLRSGARQITRESSAAKKLVDGILIFSQNNKLMPGLCSLINVEVDSDINVIKDALNAYLFPDEPSKTQSPKTGRRSSESNISSKKTSNNFGYKFDLVMNMTGLMNVTLSHMLHVDASLISRYRKGTLTPRSNPELSLRLSELLWDIVTKSGKTDELAHIMFFPPKALTKEYFYDWLCDFDSVSDSDSATVEKFLNSFDSFSSEVGLQLPSFEESAPETILNDMKCEYRGDEGLREAVIRFLGNTIRMDECRNVLHLYSDQNMDWMISDKDFRLKWASLMTMLLKKGNKIKIIHNIDRNLSEMSEAILSWLPLYMSGMVESFYCIKPCGERFSHTLFLCPDNYCIEGIHVRGTEKSGLYHYYTRQEDLVHYKNAFQKLMENSKSLVYYDFASSNENTVPESSSIIYKEYPAIPFKNMKVWASEEFVRINHNSNSKAFMVLTHPLMCKAFCAYLK